MPSIAVVIVNYNAGPLLERCLAHLERQTVPAQRVIVVDNASSDDSAEAALRRTGVELLRAGSNTGFAAGCNLGIAAVGDCEWIATLNPDAFPDENWLLALGRAIEEYPGCDAFASRIVDAADPSRIDGVGDAYHLSGLAWRRLHGRRAGARAPREVFGPCAGAALYRRSALERAGGFDEALFCYMEDVDLAFRLRLLGSRCRYVPDARVAHVGSAIVGRHSDFQLYHGHRNLVRVFVVNMPAPLFWPLLPLHFALNLASLLWFALRGRAGVLWRAKRDALRGLPASLRRRREVQRAGVVGIAMLWPVLHKGVPRVDRDD